MTPDWQTDDGSIRLFCADCLDAMSQLSECSVDSLATDPPYGLSFMGKDWDHGIPGVPFWEEALRVAKPGCHLLAFGGTRTYHRLACAIEDAGWEVRDCLAWVYGSGFPKSLDVSKAIDKAAGAERKVVGKASGARNGNGQNNDYGSYESAADGIYSVTAPATPEAQQWSGWGTALKPSFEPIILARKPLEGTVAANVLKWGTGALNIDGCRVAYNGERPSGWFDEAERKNAGFKLTPGSSSKITSTPGNGRFPANLIHDGSDEVVGLFPQSGKSTGGGRKNGDKFGGGYAPAGDDEIGYGDSGSAARFFYCAKASKSERGDGNNHPTVKPLSLMRYLVRLVTPPGGTVLDPFTGSGTTLWAARLEGFRSIGIELSQEYADIAAERINSPEPEYEPEPRVESLPGQMTLFEETA